MSDLNKTMLIGRLGQDPEIRYTASGEAVATLSVATGKKWTDKQTGDVKEHTEWHRVVFFKRLAEICGEYLTKGSQIYVEGSNRTSKWQDKDGNDRYTTEIVGNNLQMLGGKSEGKESSGQRSEKTATQGKERTGFRDKQPTQPVDDGYADDDIPF